MNNLKDCPIGSEKGIHPLQVVDSHIDHLGLPQAKKVYEQLVVGQLPKTDTDPFKGWRRLIAGRLIGWGYKTSLPKVDQYLAGLGDVEDNNFRLLTSDFAIKAVSNVDAVADLFIEPFNDLKKNQDNEMAQFYKEYERQLVDKFGKGRTGQRELKDGVDTLEFHTTSLIYLLNRKFNGKWITNPRININDLVRRLTAAHSTWTYPQASMHDNDADFLFNKVVERSEGFEPTGFNDKLIVTDPNVRFTKPVLDALRQDQRTNPRTSQHVRCAALEGDIVGKMSQKMILAVART